MLFSQWEIRNTIRREKGITLKEAADALVSELRSDLCHAVLLGQEKGASSWLRSPPARKHGVALLKLAFHDALALHHSWIPKDFLVKCIFGKHFMVEHTLSCNRGGFPRLRHNKIRDTTASLLTEVCSNVPVEPALQELND